MVQIHFYKPQLHLQQQYFLGVIKLVIAGGPHIAEWDTFQVCWQGCANRLQSESMETLGVLSINTGMLIKQYAVSDAGHNVTWSVR